MKSCVLYLALAAVTSGTILSPIVRQSGPAPVQSIGTNTYTSVGSGSPGSNCPKNVTYGTADTNARIKKFLTYGLEATMNFSEITVNGAECTGAENDTAYMAVMSRDETERFLKRNVLGLSEEAKRKVVVAGIDTQRRKCGDYIASAPAIYFFTQEIGVFESALTEQGVEPVKAQKISGEKWMVVVESESKRACQYIDVTSPSLTQNLTATPTPNATDPSPDPSPATPPPVVNGEEPIGTPSADIPIANGGRICFPGSATVELVDGSSKTMLQVEIGDRVKVADGSYSPVFMFTHKLSEVSHEFVTISTEAGDLSLTAGHYLYINGNLVPAGTVKTGDFVSSANGSKLIVRNVSTKIMTGLFNPQTIHGDIVVDGVRASTYTVVAAPRAAHALLAPLRVLYNRLALTTAIFNEGADNVAKAVNLVLA